MLRFSLLGISGEWLQKRFGYDIYISFISTSFHFMCVNVYMMDIHMHVCVYTPVCVCLCVPVCVYRWKSEVKVASSVASPSYFLRQQLSVNLEHIDLACCAGEQDTGIPLSLPHSY